MLIYGPDSWRSRFKCYIQNWKDLGSNPNFATLLSNAVINMGLVMLSLDSGPKLAMGQ